MFGLTKVVTVSKRIWSDRSMDEESPRARFNEKYVFAVYIVIIIFCIYYLPMMVPVYSWVSNELPFCNAHKVQAQMIGVSRKTVYSQEKYSYTPLKHPCLVYLPDISHKNQPNVCKHTRMVWVPSKPFITYTDDMPTCNWGAVPPTLMHLHPAVVSNEVFPGQNRAKYGNVNIKVPTKNGGLYMFIPKFKTWISSMIEFFVVFC